MKTEILVTHDCDNGSKIILSADDRNNLYVNNKKVVTQNIVKLEGWTNTAIIVGGFATLGLFLIELFKKCFS